MNEFGSYIRERRKELGLRQQEVADKAGLSVGAISMIETGERADLRLDTASKLAKALNISLDQLQEAASSAAD